MIDLLPTGSSLAAFLVAAFALALSPGPGVVYIVTRTIAQGRGAGMASVAGVGLGNFGNAVGASLGLAAIFAVSSAAFAVVKFAGAAYLIYLGVQTLRRPGATSGGSKVQATAPARILRDGFLVALLNPKTTLFFAAFLPQFIQPTASPVLQGLALSAAFVVIAATTDSAYVLLSAVLAPALRSSQSLESRGRILTAGVYFGLGIYSALADTRGSGAPVP